MTQRNTKTHWEDVYKSKDEHELSWFQAQAEPSIDLIRRYAGNKAARIVDIGAGTSRLVDTLLEDGFSHISLIDISKTALSVTAKRLGTLGDNVNFICADITEWKPGLVVNLWHDRAVFHFLTDSSLQDAYLKVLDEATSSGSIVVMGTFAPDGPEKCSGLPVRRYSAEQLHSRFGSDFELLNELRYIHVTPAGKQQPFTFVVFRRI